MASAPIHVTSSQNPVFKDLLYSLEGQGEHVLVHGFKSVKDLVHKSEWGALNTRPTTRLKTLLVRASVDLTKAQAIAELFATRFEKPVTRLALDDTLFDELDPFGVPDVIGAFSRPGLGTWTIESAATARGPGLTLLLATQNPANLGACFRSAVAFGVKSVVCLKECASPFHPRAIRGSMGHAFDLDLYRGPSIHDVAKQSVDFSDAVALDLGGEPLMNFKWPKNPILLMGEEGQGVPQTWKAKRVTIPTADKVESLNVAVSCGIALYEFASKKI